jgi:Secretion system C-terminal sorting domain
MGVNLLREDPTQYVNCVGFVREYHEWQIDEGDVYSSSGILTNAYPNNKFKWSEGYNTSTKFPEFYKSIRLNLGQTNTPIPICVSLKSCLPRLSGSGGSSPGAALEFKPVLTNESYQTDTNCAASITSNLLPEVDLITVNPCTSRDTKNPSSYIEYADWVTHFSKAFGKDVTNPTTFLDQYFKKDGLDLNTTVGMNRIGYLEFWNEQDKTWFNEPGAAHNMAEFTPVEYAAMSSFAYDGWNKWTSLVGNQDYIKGKFGSQENAYNLGAKYGANLPTNSSTFKIVFGGLSEIDTKCEGFVKEVKDWCEVNRTGTDKVFPFDVINFHHYSDNNTMGTSDAGGVSPESDYMGTTLVPETIDLDEENGVQSITINKTFKFRLRELYQVYKGANSVFPTGLELWLSEFGYDTNEKSPQRVPSIPKKGIEPLADLQEVQGRWLVRSYLEVAAAKWTKGIAFFLRDITSDQARPGGNPEGLFQSSGLLLDKANQFAPKKSYFYVYTMKNSLGASKYSHELSAFDQNSANGTFTYWNRWRYLIDATKPRIYYFRPNSDNSTQVAETIYPTLVSNGSLAVWMPTSDNSSLINFKLRFKNFPNTVTSVRVTELQSGATAGYSYSARVYTDTDGKKYIIIPKVTERPIFVKFDNYVNVPLPQCVNFVTPYPLEPTNPANFLNTNSISCDAVRLEWSFQPNLSKYMVYYYDKSDSYETSAPVFNLNDINWKLYTDNHPGGSTSIVVAGLTKLQDNYYFAVIPVSAITTTLTTTSGGMIPSPNTVCSIKKQKTASCYGGIDPSIINTLNPNNAIVTTLFDYNPSNLCQPINNNFITEWDGTPSLSTQILLGNRVIDAISLLDGSDEGTITFKFDKDFVDNNLNEYSISYFTENYEVWKTIPLPNNSLGYARLTITMSDNLARIRRLKLYGRSTSTAYPMSLNCCSPLGVAVINGTVNTDEFNAALGSSLKIVVNGKVNVNEDLTLNGKSIIMGTAAEFSVQEGVTLEINQSTLQGCDLMWKGINLQPGAIVTLESSKLRDAYQGLSVERSTNSDVDTYFSSVNSSFEANIDGIYVKPNTITSDIKSSVSVEGTVFDGSGIDLREPYPEIAAIWNPLSKSGITANNMTLLTVKEKVTNVVNNSFNPTVFTRLQVGILGDKINANVQKSLFLDINALSRFNAGIFLTNSYLFQRGFGKINFNEDNLSEFFQKLSFKNVGVPINLSKFCAFDIADNTMWEVGSATYGAIRCNRNISNGAVTSGASKIHNNFIVTLQNGIVLEDLEYPVIVERNNVDNYSNRTILGLKATGYGTVGNKKIIDIRHNSFRLKSAPAASPNIGACIYLSNLFSLNIEANQINIENYNLLSTISPEIYGVYAAAVREGTFCRNKMHGWDRIYGNGIHFDKTTESDLIGNEIASLRNGLAFVNSSTNEERVTCNTLTNDGFAVRIGNMNVLGIQPQLKNCWVGTYIGLASGFIPQYAAFIDGNPTINQQLSSQFEVTTNGEPCWNPPLASINPPSTSFFNPFPGSPDICESDTTETSCFVNHLSFLNTKEGAVWFNYASEQSNMAESFSPALRWILDRDVYNDLQAQYGDDSAILPEKLQSYVSEKKQTTVGAFYDIDKAIATISSVDAEISAILNDLIQKNAIETLNYDVSLKSFLDLSIEKRLQFLKNHGIDGLSANAIRFVEIDGLNASLEEKRKLAIKTAFTLNNTIEVTTPFERAEQTINNVYLESLLFDSLSLTQMSLVEPIADACPEELGLAVFTARDLFVRYYGFHKVSWSKCNWQNVLPKLEERNTLPTGLDWQVLIYPNPTENLVTVQTNTPLNETVNVKLYNFNGQLLQISSWQASQFELNLSAYDSGLYYLVVSNSNGQIKIQKLSIFK